MPVVETLALASLLAIIVNRVVEWWPKKALVALINWLVPEGQRATAVDLSLPLVAVGVSLGIVWYANINLLPVVQQPVVGKIVTVILCAGGASLIADIFGPFQKAA